MRPKRDAQKELLEVTSNSYNIVVREVPHVHGEFLARVRGCSWIRV